MGGDHRLASSGVTSPHDDEGGRDGRGWLARRVFPGGRDPDPRFTLANERTFLAWIRTSLAFLAAGVALAAFPLPDVPGQGRVVLSVIVLVIGMLIAAGAAGRWVRTERAMRYGRPLPLPAIVPLLSVAAVLAALLALWVFVPA